MGQELGLIVEEEAEAALLLRSWCCWAVLCHLGNGRVRRALTKVLR